MTDPSPAATDPALSLDYYPHHHHVTLRQSDGLGDEGHVPNGTLAVLCDDARQDVYTHIIGDRIRSHAIHLVEINFRFLHEVTYPGSLTIGVGIVAIGNSSMQQVIGFFRDGRCHVLCRVASVKTADGRSAPLTDAERARAQAFLVSG
ncbi:acyl-CoA thioesterase [Sphingomonas immobilis]|uniref:Hotdog domain-containing protein n=1 Tax=Sphingomonas immobilis TaxID=3063997 RepID=A0ABT8ZXK0_9SPHN|nr:thioesterase family protein [Sphingomonas sp. CA1-15]MDO7842274.1 hotdog domain-containing protein [Sphingomonas sp. CA1-15]